MVTVPVPMQLVVESSQVGSSASPVLASKESQRVPWQEVDAGLPLPAAVAPLPAADVPLPAAVVLVPVALANEPALPALLPAAAGCPPVLEAVLLLGLALDAFAPPAARVCAPLLEELAGALEPALDPGVFCIAPDPDAVL
ncbi:MAG TPA: hypothetical protein VFN67_20980 [Polyangiales bacterium]|nr:hypothetical protein [Polyangiales bacterium]